MIDDDWKTISLIQRYLHIVTCGPRVFKRMGAADMTIVLELPRSRLDTQKLRKIRNYSIWTLLAIYIYVTLY